MSRLSIQATVTPLFVKALEAAVQAMEAYQKNDSLVKESTRPEECITRELCRQVLFDNQAYRGMLLSFIEHAKEQLND